MESRKVAVELRPISDASPSGADLEYDPDFVALLLASRQEEASQFDESGQSATEPDFRDVAELAAAVLVRSHDLRAAILLAHARLRLTGFEGFAEVLSYIRGCLEDYWDTCHPQLDAEDDDDPTMRVNAVLALSQQDTILRAFRMAPVTDSPTFGRLTLRDIAIADGEITPAKSNDRQPDPAQILAALRDSRPEVMAARYQAAQSIVSDLRRIDRVFDDRTPARGPDLAPLQKLAFKLLKRLSEVAGPAPDAETDDTAPGSDAPTDAPARTGGGGGVPGTITSTADVRRTLEQLIRYYQDYEPSSPLPLILARAHRLVGADFLTIMRDMAPDGLDSVQKIGGVEDDD
jgi:type VI secretion system protein ImpA